MRSTVTALAATAMFALFSPVAFAQETPDSPSPENTAAPTKTATTQIVPPAGQPNYDALISAMNRTAAVTQQLRTMGRLTTNDFHFVKVQSLAGGNPAGLSAAMARNQSQLAALRRTVGAMKVTATTDNSQMTVAQFLADNKMSVNSIVAADVANGAVTLFVQ